MECGLRRGLRIVWNVVLLRKYKEDLVLIVFAANKAKQVYPSWKTQYVA